MPALSRQGFFSTARQQEESPTKLFTSFPSFQEALIDQSTTFLTEVNK